MAVSCGVDVMCDGHIHPAATCAACALSKMHVQLVAKGNQQTRFAVADHPRETVWLLLKFAQDSVMNLLKALEPDWF